LMVKPTNEGSFVRVGCFRHLMVSESGLKTGTEEASQLYKRFARQMAELTDGERGVLGDSVGFDEDGNPLYVIKLV